MKSFFRWIVGGTDPDTWPECIWMRHSWRAMVDRFGGGPFWWTLGWFGLGSYCTQTGHDASWSLWALRAFCCTELLAMFVLHRPAASHGLAPRPRTNEGGTP